MSTVESNDIWLGKMPSDWQRSRLRNVAALSPGYSATVPVSDEPCTVVPMELLSGDGAIDVTNQQPLDEITSGLTLFEEGDVLFAKITPCMENGKGAFVRELPTRYAFGSTEFHVLRPSKKIDGPFLYYATFNPIYRAYAAENMVGAAGQKRVSSRFVKDTRLFLPPLPEQQRIAAYLDASCAAIDAAVAAKHRQLETLDDLRTEAIHRAVTAGLNPAVKLRTSGVEWFDKIPVHWEVDRLKDVAAPNRDAIKVGPFGSDLLLGDMADGGIKVYNQRTVIDRDFDSGIHFISEEKYAQMKAFTVYTRDLLITTRGTIGRCVIVPETAQLGILHPCLMRVQTNKARMLPEYLAMLIQDCGLVLRQLQMMSAATTIDVIYSGSLKRTYLPVPPVREQQDIIAFIGQKDAELRRLTAQIEQQIATLTAYRKSLIHECVTGQRRITEADVVRSQLSENTGQLKLESSDKNLQLEKKLS